MHLLRLFALFLALASTLSAATWAATPRAADSPARVVILGVDHAVQLVAKEDQPGMLAAFIERVAPDAVCIERPPEQYARNDHYEFTYEIQDIVLPYAREHGIEVCPFDWIPSHEDQMLGWGLDLSTPPEVRAPEGFHGFLSFPQPDKLRRTLFAADDRGTLTEADAWIRGWPQRMSRDLPRRMFLYRTFMQARRIAAAAKARPGQTVLVVVGEFHKHDIEAILSDDPAISLVQPSRYGAPAPEAVERLTTRRHRIAVASFNLLGTQASTGNVDWDWLATVLAALETERRDAETDLLRTRYDLLTGEIDAGAAIERYRAIAADDAARRMPTWDGVLDRSRVDSYFDPFGNLRIDQRARVELARELYRLGETAEAGQSPAALGRELTPRKARQLEAYWQRELKPR
ncbi:hypothetical protein [Luteimonas suaedae]|uniref:hypothetical protein n=1 Tax=Luteimonas suaedae TaxID=2605430 RepID=UPI0011ED6B81|nr:hypothetical protein [Luteimonas suaedae]